MSADSAGARGTGLLLALALLSNACQSHLRWRDDELAAATRLAHVAAQVEDPDMQLALLRLAGPRLELM